MRNITVAVVCHQGIGTSLWLKVQVEKIFSKYDIPVNVFQTDIANVTVMKPDIAVGVRYLEEQLVNCAKTTIVVDNILQDKEIEKQIKGNPFVKPYLE